MRLAPGRCSLSNTPVSYHLVESPQSLIFVPILQTKGTEAGEVRSPAQGHPAGKW